jgi:hypothetical protein
MALAERDWLIPSALMTAGLGLAALLLMPVAGYDEIPPYFGRLINWMHYGLFGAAILLAWHVLKMRRAGVEQPLAQLRREFIEKRSFALAAVAGMILAGADMLFFMWIKPEVTAIAPFWADELFADMDHAIFGMDPWRLFQGIDLTFHAWAYSFFWAVAIMGTLIWLFAQRPSMERSTSLLSYFALWSVFGPIGQYFLSAAGPIFYERIGLGDRFAELSANIPEVTQTLSNYLWRLHSSGELGVGAGISAMPSLHIATVAWIFFVFRGQHSKLAIPAALFGMYIFALSVALGWHYAVDGVVGVAGALLCQALSGRFLNHRSSRHARNRGPVLALP